MSSNKELRDKIGQMFIVGFDGYSVPIEFKDFIQEYNLGGTIYFKRNVHSPAQLAELSNEIQFGSRASNTPPLFISIDHEGGKVNRLVKPFTKFPGADHLGQLNSPKIGYEFGAVLAKELKAVGININYAPVVDVNSNPNSPIIKSRAFSDDAEICGKLGSAVCRGLQKFGVMAVAKHFPGHGDTHEDSHFVLPVVDKDVKQLEELELIPFRRIIRSRVDAIMTAHILNPKLDEKYPATMSEFTLKKLLREEMRFTKLIISDDLEMKAIADNYGADEAAVLAVKAGCDLLIYRGDNGLPTAQIEAIAAAVESGRIEAAQIEETIKRIESAKKTYCDVKAPVPVTDVGKHVGLPEHFQLADIITKMEIPPGMSLELLEE